MVFRHIIIYKHKVWNFALKLKMFGLLISAYALVRNLKPHSGNLLNLQERSLIFVWSAVKRLGKAVNTATTMHTVSPKLDNKRL